MFNWIPKSRTIWSWAFVDWGNSAFSLTVMTVFFPLYFSSYWCHNPAISPEQGTQYLAFANSGYALLIAILAPFLGTIADRASLKRRFLFAFTLLGAASTLALYWIGEGQYLAAILLFFLAAFSYSGNNTFYDALLTDVSDRSDYDQISSFGFALGYVGSECLFIFNTLMVMKPEWFGLASKDMAFKWAFASTAIWWLLFTLPLMFWVKEREAIDKRPLSPRLALEGFQRLWHTAKEISEYKTAATFLLAYILYIDGINTIISMAVDYGSKIGVDQKTLIFAIHVTQWVAAPATLLYARFSSKVGAKQSIYFGILLYCGICFWARFMRSGIEFVILAALVGGVQGGVQSMSRSFFARLIPVEKSGEFFGFYNMMGKFAAVLGPLLMGLTVTHVGERNSILSLLLLFAAGAIVLTQVKGEPSSQGSH